MKVWMKIGIAAVALAVGVAGTNFARVQVHASEVTKYSDDVTIAAYYQMGVVPDVIVFDLWELGYGESAASVLGRFFAFAEEMKDREFREVHLAHRGKTKFVLRGRDFREIGRDHAFQNPVYTIRTFPEKLYTPSGRPAFSTWTGGMIGVLGAQMNDINEVADDWFLNDLRFGRS